MICHNSGVKRARDNEPLDLLSKMRSTLVEALLVLPFSHAKSFSATGLPTDPMLQIYLARDAGGPTL